MPQYTVPDMNRSADAVQTVSPVLTHANKGAPFTLALWTQSLMRITLQRTLRYPEESRCCSIRPGMYLFWCIITSHLQRRAI